MPGLRGRRAPGGELIIQERLREVERLTLRGWTMVRIAEKVGVTPRQVSEDRRVIKEEYKQERLTEQDEARDREHRRLQGLYDEAMSAYELSKTRKVKCKLCAKKKKPLPNCRQCKGDGYCVVECLGDPAFLNVARGVVHDIRELFGLNAPSKIEMKRLTIDFEDILKREEQLKQSPEQVENELEQHIKQIEQLPPAQPADNGNLPNGLHELP